MKNATPPSPAGSGTPDVAAGVLARFGQVAILLVLQAVTLFLPAGTLAWSWAWLFLGIYLVAVTIIGTAMLRTSPETIAERGRPREMPGWDRAVGGLWAVAQFLGLPVVAGLDLRFGWTGEVGAAWHLAGALAFAAGLGLFGWAMTTNAFFSTAVRIQLDRGQTVCRSGPYRFVRHPGYVGAIGQSLGIPLLLGSAWAMLAGLAAALLMVVRTALEDRLLQAELAGYREYAQEVRHRLVPGVW